MKTTKTRVVSGALAVVVLAIVAALLFVPANVSASTTYEGTSVTYVILYDGNSSAHNVAVNMTVPDTVNYQVDTDFTGTASDYNGTVGRTYRVHIAINTTVTSDSANITGNGAVKVSFDNDTIPEGNVTITVKLQWYNSTASAWQDLDSWSGTIDAEDNMGYMTSMMITLLFVMVPIMIILPFIRDMFDNLNADRK